jgi:hypothetical protein
VIVLRIQPIPPRAELLVSIENHLVDCTARAAQGAAGLGRGRREFQIWKGVLRRPRAAA